jgi:hypothetical protein
MFEIPLPDHPNTREHPLPPPDLLNHRHRQSTLELRPPRITDRHWTEPEDFHASAFDQQLVTHSGSELQAYTGAFLPATRFAHTKAYAVEE